MKKFKLGTLLTLFAMALFIFSCGDSDHSHDENGEHTEETTQIDENTDADAGADEEIDMDSKEYASAFICPMHCPGSGSDEAGTCPVCGMEYVANENVPSSDADADHDHDDHEGHNH